MQLKNGQANIYNGLVVSGSTTMTTGLNVTNNITVTNGNFNLYRPTTSPGSLATFFGFQSPYQHELWIEVGMNQRADTTAIFGSTNLSGYAGGFIQTSGSVKAISFNSDGMIAVGNGQITSSQYSAITVGGASSNLANINRTDGIQLAVVSKAFNSIGSVTSPQPFLTFNSFATSSLRSVIYPTTYTNAATVYIQGAPTTGNNTIFTNRYALYINSGNSYFGGNVNVSGSTALAGSGSTLLSIDGSSGRLFSVDDSLSGSLFSVNTAAGLPVMEAFSDNTVRIGRYGTRGLYVSQSNVGIGTETPTSTLTVNGSTTITGRVDVGTVTGGAPGNLNVNNTIQLQGTNPKIVNADASSGMWIYSTGVGIDFLYYGNTSNVTYNFRYGNSPGGGVYIQDTTGGTRNTSAKLQIDSTTLGFLPPRMTAAQRVAISAPAQGLTVYDIGATTEGLWYYSSGSIKGWQEVLSNSGSQVISGSLVVTGSITATVPTVNTYFVQGILNADTPVSNSLDMVIPFVDQYDTNNWYDAAINRCIPTIAGYYLVSFSGWFENLGTTSSQCNIQARKNGNSFMLTQTVANTYSGQSLSATKITYMNGTTDYVDFSAYQSTGGLKNLQKGTTDGSGTWFTMHLLTM